MYKFAGALVALTCVLTNTANGAEVSCEYHSNSEWPWIDSRICQTEERPLILNDEGTPICSDSRADKDGDGWGWENNASCIIDPNQEDKRGSEVPSQKVDQEDLIVFEQDFESANVGPLQPDVLNETWKTPLWHMGVVEGRAEIVQDVERGKAIQVLFPAHRYGSDGAVAFLNDLSFGVNFDRNFEELYVSYDVKFSKDFDFVLGGKLPGLCGYNTTQDPKDGCNTGGGFPTGHDGWSARGMWRVDGVLENYMYHADQFYQYGDDEIWDVKAQRGQWHTLQHRVVMNTVGEANGIIEAWFDGVKVLSSNHMLYRKTADIGINLFYFSTFYGGADPSWAPSSDQYMYFDNFRIATTPLPETEETVVQQVSIADVQPVEQGTVQEATTQAEAATSKAATQQAEIITLQEPAQQAEIITLQEPAQSTLSNSMAEPTLGAAQELESSGGGVFQPWWLCLLFIARRKRKSR